MSHTCIPNELLRDQRYRALKPSVRCAAIDIIGDLQQIGDAMLSDEQLRAGRLGPKGWNELLTAFLDAGWFRRAPSRRRPEEDEDRIARAGVLHPETLQKRARRAGDSIDPDLLGLEHEMEHIRRENREILSILRADKSPTDHRQTADKSPTNGGQSAATGAARIQPPAPIELNSIGLNSSSNEEIKIQLNSIADDAPAPDQRTRIRSALAELGVDVNEIDRAMAKRTLDEIAEGLECLELGYWESDKKPYKPLTTMRNYLSGALGLNSKYKALLRDRGTGALALLFAVDGGRKDAARPSPTCTLQRPPPLTPEQEAEAAAARHRAIEEVRQKMAPASATG